MSVKLTYNTKKDAVVMIHKGKTVAFLDSKDMRTLIEEVKKFLENANPAVKALAEKKKRKARLKAERKQLINQLKILLTIKWIDFVVKIKGFFNKK